ncbi:SusC/RagA family TonB-linked outer membrane protein [Mucilaginibacter pocheonensis]|uniref:TonB-linked SusC/RagA family outer membrane protein n=1 Tax=Mucilaginibacter pocheonensis TaxID=398050 RepID=A0ABU1T7R9_9SPHI|nr:TonB-dependent receptor [Mucilaginibacter pocheonensis]MDR6941452.1 TonB-linked SusC/RagA family outer membrane protein [Mucilaginibacter pocheonensis]
MKKLLLIPLLFIFFTPFIALAQQTQPTINSKLVGRVVDGATKEPLPGAVVRIEGTTHVVSTDIQGKFSFVTGQKFPYKLIITFIGYEKQEYIADGSPVEILMKDAQSQLNQVVVVGYGTQKRKDITGSVASVPVLALKQPVPSLDRVLQGTVSGIQVTQATGQPGAGVTVQIRGVNSINAVAEPLYIIDGFPTSNSNSLTDAGVTNGPKINPLASINTADIENIEVLKDASATAIYGTRGANGVIIITTKKGKSGVSSINYDGSYGRQEVIKTIPLLNASQWGALRNDALVNSGKTPQTEAQLNPYNADTNWQDAAFRTGNSQNHSLSILSGTDRTRLAFSGNYFKQDGILQNTNFERYAGRVNVEHDYNDKLKISSFITGSRTRAQVAPQGVVPAILLMTPTTPVYNPDGSFFIKNVFEGTYGNPINTLYNQINTTTTSRILGNISADYKITDDLTARVLTGVDIIDNKQNRYLPASVYEGSGYSGLGETGTLNSTNWLNENTLTYTKKLGNHNLNILAGFTQQAFNAEGAVTGSSGFVSDYDTFNNLGSGSITSISGSGFAVAPSSSTNTWALKSYLGRVNYGYNGKYLLTLTLRADGSSKFAPGHQWASFPSAAVAWNASSENFLKNVEQISQLKFRLSAGQTGNSDIPPYQSFSQLGYYRYNFGNTTLAGFAPNSLSNPNLTWEKTTQYDFGFDLGLLKDRITLTADIYYKKTTNLLLYLPLPATSGLTIITNTAITNPQQYENVGSVQNKGFELSINTHNFTGSFVWNTSLVFAVNRNKVLSLGGNGVNQFIPDSSLPSILRVGEPIGSFIGYKTNGLIQAGGPALTPAANTAPGGQAYQDINGDGKITQSADRVILGNSQPKFTGGITNTFSYKGIDLNVSLQGSYGNKIYNQQRGVLELGTGYTNATATLLNRWTPANTNTDVHSAFQDPAATISDRFVENGSYLRLKNLSLGYTIPKSIVSRSFIKKIRIYVTAQNLVTWTKYTGYDPEVSSNEQSAITSGVDNGAYPNNKSILAGIGITL